MRQIIYYRTPSGRSPVEQFVGGLLPKQRGKIGWVLGVVRTSDRVPAEYLKKLAGTDGLWEVRAAYGGDAFRLLCFFDAGNLVVLLTAFAKKTEDTPLLEIELAQQRRRDYLSRKVENGG